MDNLYNISNGKYKFVNCKLTEGAYSKIYNIIKTDCKKSNNKNYIVKIQKISDRYEAVNEIKILKKINENKTIYFENIKNILSKKNENNNTLSYLNTSKIIDILDYYSDREYIYIIFKKYEYTLEEFNILYHKTFNENLPYNLIQKITNSLFLGLYELSLTKYIHCDIKPNNIMINSSNKQIKELFNLIKKNKLKKEDLINYIDILYIDFNLSQKYAAYCKSVKIQTLYYMAPEIVLGNSNFNESIDIWSIGCIIYELLTGKYLFDVLNYNYTYGEHFINYDISNSNKSCNSSNQASDSSSDYSESYYYNNQEELILLYLYREFFGDNPYIIGDNVDKYYNTNNKLLFGTINIKELNNNQFIEYIKNNINKYSTNIQNIILELFNKIFIYDFNKRLTINEYFDKFLN